MACGTLYTYADNFRAFKALIAAEYSGAKVSLGDFKFGQTNTSADFLNKFPSGKVPAFEGSDGFCLSGSNAIASYVASDALRGADAKSAALVQAYIEFADNEILPPGCTWVFPTLGIKQYNKAETDKAMAHVKLCLEYLNNALASKTFLVGERVTLADIALCCNLLMLYKQVLDPTFRAPFGNVTRWFLTCVNQPEFKKVLGTITLSEKMAQFDAKKFSSLNPKPAKDNKKKDKKEPQKKKETPKKEEAEDEEEAQLAPKRAAIDPFAGLPPTTFILDEWKRKYSNTDTEKEAIPWFYENIDKEGYSQWFMEYKYNHELKRIFMSSNLIGGMFQRLERLKKNAFASVLVTGEDNDNKISGVWLFRGQKLAFNLNPDWDIDAPQYSFRRLEWDNEADQQLFKKYLLGEGEFYNYSEGQVMDIKTFK